MKKKAPTPKDFSKDDSPAGYACGLCFYFFSLSGDLKNGQCRRFPPSHLLVPKETKMPNGQIIIHMVPMDAFPTIEKTSYCGEFKAKNMH